MATASRSPILNAFHVWDTNGDGFINEGDLHKVLTTIGMSRRNVQTTFLAMDVNRDGRVDYNEFISWLEASSSPKHSRIRDQALMEGAFGDCPEGGKTLRPVPAASLRTKSPRPPARAKCPAAPVRAKSPAPPVRKSGEAEESQGGLIEIAPARLLQQQCYNMIVEVKHPMCEVLDLKPDTELDRADSHPDFTDPAAAALWWLQQKPHRDWKATNVVVFADVESDLNYGSDAVAAEVVATTLREYVPHVQLCPDRVAFLSAYPWLTMAREKTSDPVRRTHLLWRMWPSEVLPGFLFLGSLGIVTVEWLEAMNVTHVLTALTDEDFANACEEAGAAEVLQGTRFEIHRAVIDDAADADLVSIMSSCCDFLYKVQREGGRVLVHCGGGVSRSPAIVSAFLIHSQNMSCANALDFVKTRRSWVRTDRFSAQLKLWSNHCGQARSQK